jgi:hypothetical protein
MPVVLAVARIKANKKKKKKGILRKQFEDFAIRNNLSIDKKQIVRGNMIGIDRLNFKLVFLIGRATQMKFYLIDMENIVSCKLNKDRHKVKGHISKISLQCEFEKGIPGIHFVFFDETIDDAFRMMSSFKKASYWKKCINIYTESANLSYKKNKKIA